MKLYKVDEFTKGWIIGDFYPSVDKRKDFEIAIKYYKKDEYEERHLHKMADEYTIIVNGKVEMNKTIYLKGDIILIEKGESTDFKALEDTETVVIKIPSIMGDKYLA